MIRKKITAIVLAASLTTGFIQNPIRVEALSIDELYANAYRATVSAMEGKNQKLINEARAAIKMLPQNLNWAIGEFSKQVDKVQHPIFVKAYNAVVLAEKNPTQANIDAAKEAIDPDMPIYYRGSYSSKIDQIQQNKMKEALDAYKKALETQLEADIEKANKLLEDIKTSKNLAIAEWVDLVQAKGKLEDLNNSKVNTGNYAILSNTGVYGPKDELKPTTVKGNILVSNSAGKTLTLQNINIEGTLTVNFGSGDVVLNNVKVNGVTVNNIGANSLHVKGESEIKDISIKDSDNDARIVIEDNASIKNANVLSGAKLEVSENSTNSKAFENVVIAPVDTNKVILDGSFASVSVDKAASLEVAKDSKVSAITLNSDAIVTGTGSIEKLKVETSGVIDIQAKSVETLEVSKKAEGAKVNLSEDTKVETLNVNASANVTGKGTIENANIGANGTTIEIKPGNVSVTEGVKVEVAGEVKDETNSEVIEKVPEIPETPENSEENTPPVVVPPSNDESTGGSGDYNPPVSTKPSVNTFINEINKYLGHSFEGYETYEANNKGALNVLKKYKAYFSELSQLNELSDKNQLRYAATFRSLIRNMKAEGIKFTYDNVEVTIKETYEIIQPIIESEKFVGHFGANNKVINFKVPESEVELDVTDSIIQFESKLNEGTTYEIVGVYDYAGSEKVENEYFVVKENRIFVKPNIKVGTINTNIEIKVMVNNNSSITNLNLQAEFPEDPEFLAFVDEISKYLIEDESWEDIENNNIGTLNVLKKYKDYFKELKSLDDINENLQKRFASYLRSNLIYMKNSNIKFTYKNIEESISNVYKEIDIMIELSKFEGYYDAKNSTINFEVPEGEDEIDVTDDLIRFESDLKESTTYKILGVYDYTDNGQEESKYFSVREDENGENRIFVNPNNNVGKINGSINVVVKTENGEGNIYLNLVSRFPQDPKLTSFMDEIGKYPYDYEDSPEEAENKNEEVLKILKKYKDYFPELSKLDELSEKHQLRYADDFRWQIKFINDSEDLPSYEEIKNVINYIYGNLEVIIESEKFIGHHGANTNVINFKVPEIEKELDVTDELIKFESPLNEGTTYEILKVYDYVNGGEEDNEYFFVKDNRIFVKSNIYVGTINTNIQIKVMTQNGITYTNLNLKAEFPQDPKLIAFIREFDEYIGEDSEDAETHERNNKSTLEILKKYTDYFPELSKLNELSDKYQLIYAANFRANLKSIKNNNINVSYKYIEGVINGIYDTVELEMEVSKFKGNNKAETSIIDFIVEEAQEEIDVTDKIIDFDKPLSDDTTYEIISIYNNINGKEEDSEYFSVREGRIFVKPNNQVGTIYTTIKVKVTTYKGVSTIARLSLKAKFPQDSNIDTFNKRV